MSMRNKDKIFYCFALVFVLLSCKNEDFSPKRPITSYGKISFIDSNQTFSATISEQPYLVEMDVYSAIVAPNELGEMETRIFAWNGREKEDFRSLSLVFRGTSEGFSQDLTYSVNFAYSYLNPSANTLGITKSDFLPPIEPAFHYHQRTPLENRYIPIKFSNIQLNQNIKKITYNTDKLEVYGKNLYDFKLDINSLGGVNIPISNCVTFNLNGNPEGSFQNQSFRCIQDMKDSKNGKLGIQKMSATFDEGNKNKLKSLEISFKHLDNKLAYNGPVGKFIMPNGTDYTEISVVATDQEGKIYREQSNKGYVKAISEKIWGYDNSRVLYKGFVLLKFEFDLISSDGDILNITNGNALYETTPELI